LDGALREFPSFFETSEECLGVRLIGKQDICHTWLVRCRVRLALHLRHVAFEEGHLIHICMQVAAVGLALDSLLIRSFRLSQLIQLGIALYQIEITSAAVRIKAYTFNGFCLCFFIFSQQAVAIPQHKVRVGVPG
jgi:hypothetical protein